MRGVQHHIALALSGFLFVTTPVLASISLGAGKQAFNVKVVRIFSGQSTTYVTFTDLPGCNSYGGYLTVSWPAANGGDIDQHRTSQIVATLLFAKATSSTMEVRYRQNLAPTGWDSCAIDAVFLD